MMDTCQRPGTVTEDDLVAFAYGEADQLVADHIRACPACAAAAAEYAQFSRRLGEVIYRVACPSPEALVLAEQRRLPPDEQLRLIAHIRDCPHCTDEAALVRQLPDEPNQLAAGAGTRLRRIIATLVGSAPGALPAGVRGTGAVITRTYRTDDLIISVHLDPDGRSRQWSVHGGVWSEAVDTEALADSPLTLIGQDGQAWTARLGALGDFAFEGVAAGPYRLEIIVADENVVVEDLRLER